MRTAILRSTPLLVLLLACSDGASVSDVTGPSATTSPAITGVLLAAGDISSCSNSGDAATAKLLDQHAGTVLTLGDNVYESGTASEFSNCYGPTWGRHRSRTRPVPGNHEYKSAGAAPYFAYFGSRAGSSGKGYYSFDLGGWHVIALNSNISVSSTSTQVQWLKADLAAHPAKCTLAYWHHPRFSSGGHGNYSGMQALWQALYDARADVVLAGHDHDYERFAPQTPTGGADATRGIREFVVGTGGRSLRPFSTIRPNSQYRYNGAYGVLKLELSAGSYKWKFINTSGTVKDTGTGTCH